MEAQNIIVLKYLLPLETKEDTNTNNISQLTSMSSLSFCLSAAWGPPPSCKAVCWHCNWEITSLSCCSSRLKSATRSVNLQWSQSQLYPGTSLFRCYGNRDYWLEGKSLCSHVHPQNTSLMALYIVASTLAPFPTSSFRTRLLSVLEITIVHTWVESSQMWSHLVWYVHIHNVIIAYAYLCISTFASPRFIWSRVCSNSPVIIKEILYSCMYVAHRPHYLIYCQLSSKQIKENIENGRYMYVLSNYTRSTLCHTVLDGGLLVWPRVRLGTNPRLSGNRLGLFCHVQPAERARSQINISSSPIPLIRVIRYVMGTGIPSIPVPSTYGHAHAHIHSGSRDPALAALALKKLF